MGSLRSRYDQAIPVHMAEAAGPPSVPSRSTTSQPLPLLGDPAALAALARSAAAAGVVPPFGGCAADAVVHGGPLGADGQPLDFHSPAVRFAVALAESLEGADARRTGAPSVEGCLTCLATLRSMVPLLGPLGPVLQTVHDALGLCVLSEESSAEGLVAGFDEAAAAAKAEPTWPTAVALADGQWPANASAAAAAATRLTSSSSNAASAALAVPTSSEAGSGVGPTAPLGARFPGGAAVKGQRVPYFLLVRKLEEERVLLRQERDRALDEVVRGSEDLTNLDEQLSTAREQLHAKTKTIDKLVREHNALEAELKGVREALKASEHKYEVLQHEAAAMTRDFLSQTQKLEEECDRLRMINTQLVSAASSL